MCALPRVVRGLRALRDISVAISVVTSCVVVGRVFNRFFDRAFNRDDSGRAFTFFSAGLSFFRWVVGLVRTQPSFGSEVGRTNKAGRLFCSGAFELGRFVFYQDNASVSRLLYRFYGLFGFWQAIIRNYKRARTVFCGVSFANAISSMRNASL